MEIRASKDFGCKDRLCNFYNHQATDRYEITARDIYYREGNMIVDMTVREWEEVIVMVQAKIAELRAIYFLAGKDANPVEDINADLGTA